VRRHIAIVGLVWLVLTVGGLIFIQIPFEPAVRSDKGLIIDETFQLLLMMSVPVFTFVVAILGYSAIAFRHRGEPEADGKPLTGRGPVPLAWFVVTSVMAIGVMVYPGLTELPKVVKVDPKPDVIVQIQGLQWAWSLTYPNEGVKTSKELVLPVGKSVGFEMTAADVIHSVWIPSFRMRLDAVPGLKTYMSFTPTEIGSYEQDTNMRLQCSQLCGGNHALMAIPVRVVSDADFASWVAANGGGGGGGPVAGAQQLTVAANNPAGTTEFHFDPNALQAKAATPITLTFSNNDNGIVHNIAVTKDGDAIGATDFAPGVGTQVLNIDALEAGTYQFLCQAHPTTMTGTLEVK